MKEQLDYLINLLRTTNLNQTYNIYANQQDNAVCAWGLILVDQHGWDYLSTNKYKSGFEHLDNKFKSPIYYNTSAYEDFDSLLTSMGFDQLSFEDTADWLERNKDQLLEVMQ